MARSTLARTAGHPADRLSTRHGLLPPHNQNLANLVTPHRDDSPPGAGLSRRGLLGALPALAWSGAATGAPAPSTAPAPRGVGPRPLVFPVDFGAHPDTRIEWWYVTGWLGTAEQPRYGFQITFFRSRTDVDARHSSAFAATQLLFAHAALSDVGQRHQRHDQRIARAGFGLAQADEGDTEARLRDWLLQRQPGAGPADVSSLYRARLHGGNQGGNSTAWQLDLQLATTQPLLLQGAAGYSRKGPQPDQASHYYSQPQLAVAARLQIDGQSLDLSGRAWLDHEWSNSLLDPAAVGWDWIGINLFDGRALTAFRLRRADGSTLWAGGSLRGAAGAARSFTPAEVQFSPEQRWTSPATAASYPVQWQIDSPAGRHRVRALFEAQELDSRASTGTVYWEGLSELLDEQGRRIGLGYLEMTGYAGRQQMP
jgi:predicted secreted hydrolase